MSFKDVIKNSVMEQFTGTEQFDVTKIMIMLIVSAAIGIYIFFLYKNQSKAAFYSKDLNITIAGLPVVVCAIMLAMQNNLIVSLGMVGALSIVRFRNAVKNPLDLLYFFWSISAGIICGVGLYILVIALCLIMTCLIVLLQLVPTTKAPSVLLLRTSRKEVEWSHVNELIKACGRNVKEKSRCVKSEQIEAIYELRVVDEDALMNKLQEFGKFDQIHLLSHDGEYRI